METNASEQLRVLIADDDQDTVLTLSVLLQDEGHVVLSAADGKQALAAVADFQPDAVLLDIALPGLSGWEVARTLRGSREVGGPVLIGISGQYKLGADKILSQILGFQHYLLKPFDPSALLELLKQKKGARL